MRGPHPGRRHRAEQRAGPARSGVPERRRMSRLGGSFRALALAFGIAAALAGPVGACTTALPPRPVADYRAAQIVVVGILERSDPNLVVRVETRYRGPATARVVLRPGDFVTWCPFPLGVPEVGERVLLAVVDPKDWQWPNSATWAVDDRGRIRNPMAPWSGAPAPRTLAEALETMGIPPDTATVAAPPLPSGTPPPALPALLAGAVGLLVAAGRFKVRPRRVSYERRSGAERNNWRSEASHCGVARIDVPRGGA